MQEYKIKVEKIHQWPYSVDEILSKSKIKEILNGYFERRGMAVKCTEVEEVKNVNSRVYKI